MQQPIKELYGVVKDTEIFLDEEDFNEQLTKDPKGVFELIKKEELFIDYNDFESTLGLKKKEATSTPFWQNYPQESGEKPAPFLEKQPSGVTKQPTGFLAEFEQYVKDEGVKQSKEKKPVTTPQKEQSKFASDAMNEVIADADQEFRDFSTGNQTISPELLEQKLSEHEGGNLTDNLLAGAARFNQGLAEIPGFVYDVFAIPQNALGEILGQEGIKTSWGDFVETQRQVLGNNSPVVAMDNIADYYRQSGEYYDQTKVKFDESIADQLANGNYGDAGMNVLAHIVESIPSTAGMYLTGGTANFAQLGKTGHTIAMSLPFMSEKNAELENNPDVPDYLKPVSGALYGLAEVVFDQEFGTKALLDNLVKVYKTEGKEAAEKMAKEFTTGYLNSTLGRGKNVLNDAAKNSIEEMTTQFSQNLVAKYSGEKPDINLTDGMLDAGIVGGAQGTIVSTASNVLEQKKANSWLNTAAKDLDATKQQLDAQVANGSLSPKNAEMLYKKAEERSATLQKMPDNVRESEVAADIAPLIEEKEKLKTEAKEKDDAFKPQYDEKISAINEKINNIQNDGQGGVTDDSGGVTEEGSGNGVTEKESEGVDEKNSGEVVESKAEVSAENKPNDIEAKKPDIEKRSQEEEIEDGIYNVVTKQVGSDDPQKILDWYLEKYEIDKSKVKLSVTTIPDDVDRNFLPGRIVKSGDKFIIHIGRKKGDKGYVSTLRHEIEHLIDDVKRVSEPYIEIEQRRGMIQMGEGFKRYQHATFFEDYLTRKLNQTETKETAKVTPEMGNSQNENSENNTPSGINEAETTEIIPEQVQSEPVKATFSPYEQVEERRVQDIKDLIEKRGKAERPTTKDGLSFDELLDEQFPPEDITEPQRVAKELLKRKYEAAGKPVKKSLAEAKKALKEAFDDFGILDAVYDPSKQAQKMINLHKALVDFAKAAISEGAQSVHDMAKQMGYKVNVTLQKAWDEATGVTPPAQKIEDLGFKMKDMEEVQKSISEGKKMRGFGKRVRELAELQDMRAKIDMNPESYYQPQNIKQSKEKLQGLSDDEIVAEMDKDVLKDAMNGGDNVSVLAGLELLNRGVARGEDVSDIVTRLNKTGTALGQLLRQFAELKTSTPEGVVLIVEKTLEGNNRYLLPEHRQNLLALATENIRAAQAKKDFVNLVNAQGFITEQQETQLKELAKAVDDSYVNLSRYVNGIVPKGIWDILGMAVQGNLLTPLSQVTNVYSNVLLTPVKGVSSAIPTATDALISHITNKQRTLTISKASTKGSFKGAWYGLKVGTKQLFTGVNTADGYQLEIAHGFQPLRAWSQLWFSTIKRDAVKANMAVNAKGKVPVADRMAKLIEATSGMPAETMFRFLNLFDKPFYYFHYFKRIEAEADKRGLKGDARKMFIMFPNQDILEKAEASAKESVFQEDGLAAKFATGVFGQMQNFFKQNNLGFLGFVVKTQVPYIKTPVNVVSQTLDFAIPPLSLGKAAYHFIKGDRREGLLNLGKSFVGLMIVTAADSMFELGIISGSGDEDNKKERALQYEIIPPNSVNLSALKRWLNGESPKVQEGDNFINYQKMGIIGGVFGLRSNIGKELDASLKEKGRDESWLDFPATFVTSFPAIASYASEQSFLKGTSALLEAVADKDWDKWLANTFKAVSSIALPNTLDAINRAEREFMPSVGGDNVEERLGNVIKGKLFMTEDLPIKHGLWGDKIKQTPEGNNPWLYQLVDVTKGSEVKGDELSLKVYELYKSTGDAKVIPSVPAKKITHRSKTYDLSEKQYEDWIEKVGVKRRELAEKIISKSDFKSKDAEKQIKLLDKAYGRAMDDVKVKFLKEQGLL